MGKMISYYLIMYICINVYIKRQESQNKLFILICTLTKQSTIPNKLAINLKHLGYTVSRDQQDMLEINNLELEI